jgi:hypothetical protein
VVPKRIDEIGGDGMMTNGDGRVWSLVEKSKSNGLLRRRDDGSGSEFNKKCIKGKVATWALTLKANRCSGQ